MIEPKIHNAHHVISIYIKLIFLKMYIKTKNTINLFCKW